MCLNFFLKGVYQFRGHTDIVKLYAVLRINADYSDAIHTNCTIASFFIMLCFVTFSPWTIAGFVSVNFGYVHNSAYFKDISLITLKT